jgi:tetratricopeptide (TPR) repeat protein
MGANEPKSKRQGMKHCIAILLFLACAISDVSAQCATDRASWGKPRDAVISGHRAREWARSGHFEEAERLFKLSLEIYEQCLKPEDVHIRHARSQLSNFYNRRGRLDEAEHLLKRNLDVSRGLPLAHQYENELASFYEEHERFGEAEELLQQAFEKEAAGSRIDFSLGAQSVRLAMHYVKRGQSNEAERLSQHAIAIAVNNAARKFSSDRDDPFVHLSAELISQLKAVAALYDDQGQPSKAESLYKQIVAIFEEHLPQQLAKYQSALSAFAEFYHRRGRHEEAEPLLQRAIAIHHAEFVHSAGDKTNLQHLALLYREMRRYDEAEPILKRLLEIDEKTSGRNEAFIGASLILLGSLYAAQGKHDAAVTLYQRAREMMDGKQMAGEALAECLAKLGDSYEALGRMDMAKIYYDEAESKLLWFKLDARESSHHGAQPQPPQTDESILSALISLYIKRGRIDEAEPLARRMVTSVEEQYGPEHRTMAHPLQTIAGIYGKQGRFTEAEPHYQRALAIQERTRGADHPETRTLRMHLEAAQEKIEIRR